MQRNNSIDILRGIAMVAMILIHTSYYFISDKLIWQLWNWSQFAVPVFIFCSGYVFFMKDRIHSLSDFMTYLKKRVTRLLIPYYIFMLFFLPIVWFTTPNKVTTNYILQSIFLIGGIDINWLVLLMLELLFIFPLISYMKRNLTLLFYLFTICSLLFSIFIIYSPVAISYKLTMWLPWSIIGILSYILLSKNKRYNLLSSSIACIVFLTTYFSFIFSHRDISFINNKYPPNILLLSYGVWTTLGLYWLAEKNVFKHIVKFLSFMSQHSYAIFFIHYCILIATVPLIKLWHIPWIIYFSGVLFITISIKYCYLFMIQNLKIKNFL